MPSRAVLVSFVCMYVASFSSTPCEAHGIPDHVVSYFLHGAPNAFLTSKVLVSLERHRQAPLTILLISLISRRDIEDTSTWMFLGWIFAILKILQEETCRYRESQRRQHRRPQTDCSCPWCRASCYSLAQSYAISWPGQQATSPQWIHGCWLLHARGIQTRRRDLYARQHEVLWFGGIRFDRESNSANLQTHAFTMDATELFDIVFEPMLDILLYKADGYAAMTTRLLAGAHDATGAASSAVSCLRVDGVFVRFPVALQTVAVSWSVPGSRSR